MVYQTAVASDVQHYPSLNDSQNYNVNDPGTDWIAGAANHSVFIEYWRFYQSGQFVHHLAMREDHMTRLGLFRPQLDVPREDKTYLAVTSSICMVTNIVEFAARLAYRGVLAPRAVIAIKLHKMAGRQLIYIQPERRLPGSFWFKDDNARLEGLYSTEEVIGRPREIAVDLAVELFKRTGWDAPRSLIVDDQSRCTPTKS